MSRRIRKPLSPRFETLEPRQLPSHSSLRQLAISAAAAHAPLHTQAKDDARPDLDAFAQHLVSDHRTAARLGLTILARELKQHSAYAAQHGWGGALVLVLEQHPAYTAHHHLGSLLSPPRTSQRTTTAKHQTSHPAPKTSSTALTLSKPSVTPAQNPAPRAAVTTTTASPGPV